MAVSLFAAAVFGGLTGCTTVQVTDDMRGEVRLHEVQVFVDAGFERAYDASLAGLRDTKLFQVKNDKAYAEAELEARDSADTLVTIKIKEVAQNRTSIKIRYGIPGNVADAQNLFKAIESHL